MFEVTCDHCGRSVHVSPDAFRCSLCGHDLHTLIPEQYAASYFYRRAADLAARGDIASALAEAERGLGSVESSELRLLAAILAKRQGDIDTVRIHVAAIPVDDRLRQEAEWMIRGQPAPRSQEPPRKERAAARAEDAPQHAGSPFEGTTVSAPPEPEPVPAAPRLPRSAVWTQRIWGFVALMLVLVAGGMGWLLLSGGPDALLALLPGLAPEQENAQSVGPLQPVTPLPLQLPTATPRGTPTVPQDWVSAPAAEAVVDAAAGASGLQAAAFDLPSVLSASGRADLAALALSADLQGSVVRISGIITNTADRDAIIALAGSVGGVTEVSAVDLLVRVPPTYTVQSGDTLWQIVERFYGSDAQRVAQIFALNQDVLPSAQAIQAGMELKLPPFD